MDRKKLILGIVVTITISLSLLLFFVLLFLGFYFRFEEKNGSQGKTFHEYKFLEYDAKRNKSSFGLVWIPQEINENEFVSYDEDDHRQVLISNHGSQEYLCTGSCYCERNERRSSFAVHRLSRGVLFLLTAVSSVFAMNKAKEYFEEECANEHLDSCSLESIVSNVDECSPIVEDIGELFKSTTEEPFRESFICEGNCLVKKYKKNCEFCVKTVTDRALALSQSFGCESLRMAKEVVLDSPSDIVIQDQDRVDDLVQCARYKFQEFHLREFCYQQSIEHDVINYSENGKNYFVKKDLHLCVGSNKIGINPTIECVKVV